MNSWENKVFLTTKNNSRFPWIVVLNHSTLFLVLVFFFLRLILCFYLFNRCELWIRSDEYERIWLRYVWHSQWCSLFSVQYGNAALIGNRRPWRISKLQHMYCVASHLLPCTHLHRARRHLIDIYGIWWNDCHTICDNIAVIRHGDLKEDLKRWECFIVWQTTIEHIARFGL